MAEPLTNPPEVTNDPEYGNLDQAIEEQQELNAIAETRKTPREIDNEIEAVTAFDEESRLAAEAAFNETDGPTISDGITSVNQVRSRGGESQASNTRAQEDWRLRLKLAKNANYFYANATSTDLLWPLRNTDGVVFPYTPSISLNYRSNYEVSDLVHTNYKQYFYKNSSVEEISITADFTAQDTAEANYLLAVIHFFKTVTKMFYGKDTNPLNGTPPPLCYLLGYGQFQFSDHPVLISGFQYTLPNDVDYIRAGSVATIQGTNLSPFKQKPSFLSTLAPSLNRLFGSNLSKGGGPTTPAFNPLSNPAATYVPTKIQLIINAIPIVTRGDIADNFSLSEYAKGNLVKKGYW
jgi:hypothetical protein